MSSIINVAYTVTQNMHYMALVSMQSVLKSNSNNQIKFYIIYDNSFDKVFLNSYLYYEKFNNCIGVSLINASEKSKIFCWLQR